MNAASSQEPVKVVNAPTAWEVISASARGVMLHPWMAPAVLVGIPPCRLLELSRLRGHFIHSGSRTSVPAI